MEQLDPMVLNEDMLLQEVLLEPGGGHLLARLRYSGET
jgi:hypothetical protein